MMRPGSKQLPLLRSVRAKLLLVLAVLSLPLLVVSLIQLNNYRRDLDEQTATTARLETTAAAGSLLSWLESHPSYVARAEAASTAEVDALYARLYRDTAADAQTAIAVFDAQGRALKPSTARTAFPSSLDFPAQGRRGPWSDGVARMTALKEVEQSGWKVAVGVPLAEDTTAGKSTFMLAATWALALLASILLGVWSFY
jgi:hypothetical protein